MQFRVNTPGPSFAVEADNLDQATAIAVGRGFPEVRVQYGQQAVQFERTVDNPKLASHGKTVRYVHLVTRGGNVRTGFCIYQEA